jgi:hypothetical protein
MSLVLILLQVRFITNRWCAAAAITVTVFVVAFLSRDSAAVTLQLVILVTLAFCMKKWKWRYRDFAIAAIASSLLSFASISLFAYLQMRSYQERRERYAQELVAERLPSVKKSTGEKLLAPSGRERLVAFERRFSESRQMDKMLREMALQNLHTKKMATFVNSSGFGVRRIIGVPTEEQVKPPEMASPIAQPGTPDDMQWSDSAIAKESPKVSGSDLEAFHLGSVFNFVNPRGFGYVSEEKRLYGFQPHHFRELPSAGAWQVRRLELVSLLLHDEPRVYVTNDLPRMDKIRGIPTRALDLFESTGLAKLQTDEDLFISETPHGIRMLGAVRAIEICTTCHGGERGDLLGAFSYSLARNSEN